MLRRLAEHIVYGRLLTRLAEIGAIVGTQQLSLLPVTREEFQQLADKTLTETELEQRATERALWAAAARQVWRCRHRTSTVPTCVWSNRGAHTAPVDLDTLWETLAQSAYLRALGCRVLPDVEQRIMLLAGIPDVPDGTAVTTSRTTFEAACLHSQAGCTSPPTATRSLTLSWPILRPSTSRVHPAPGS